VWATYANSIRIGNRMLVPIYRDPVSEGSPLPQEVKDRIMRQEAESLATYQSVLDNDYGVGVVQVVPVVSDDMIPCQGSMHCISMTYAP
jgi:agmatine/peptidylarginine deiminase